MFRKLRSVLAIAVVILFVTAVTLVAEETMSGTIQDVDAQEGRMTLRSEKGKTVELQALPQLLAGLQAGDAIEVRVSGQKAMVIRKQAGTQRPDMGSMQRPDMSGTQQPQRPDGLPPTQ